jgi:hypothetical protein
MEVEFPLRLTHPGRLSIEGCDPRRETIIPRRETIVPGRETTLARGAGIVDSAHTHLATRRPEGDIFS